MIKCLHHIKQYWNVENDKEKWDNTINIAYLLIGLELLHSKVPAYMNKKN